MCGSGSRTPCCLSFPAGASSTSLAVGQSLLVLLFLGWFVCLYVDPAREASLALFHFRFSPLHSRPPPKGSPFASCWRFPTGAHRPRRLPCASCPRMDCERGLPFLPLALPASASGRTLCTMLVVPGWGSPARPAPLCKFPSLDREPMASRPARIGDWDAFRRRSPSQPSDGILFVNWR